MPSATRAESLVGVSEVIDGPQPIDPSSPNMAASGFALTARAAALPTFPALGPPDMLYVRKRYIPVVGGPKLYGYYHFIRGVETSHVAAISAYIVDVVRNNGLDPLSWVSAGAWEIASATFSAYNCISKADLIVHVDLPGSTTAIAKGPDGRPLELTDLFWAELLVSSFVRDLNATGEDPLYPCLRVISPFTSLHVEPLFLDAAAECAHRWHLSGADSFSGATLFAARSRIPAAIRDHLIGSSRYDAAIEFFQRLRVCQVDPDCAAHAAAAARLKGDLAQASAIVDKVITANPDSELAWLERAKNLRFSGDLEKALEAAKRAASRATENIEVWVVLADLYVDLKQYAQAFEALNSAQMPPPSLDPFLRELVPNRKHLTTPVEGASQGTDAVRVLANRFREEKNMSTEKTDDTLSELPGKLMTDVEQSCYAVLVKILNDLSWDEMLAVRGECFVMETDVENGRVLMTEELDADDPSNGEVAENGDVPDDDGEEADGSVSHEHLNGGDQQAGEELSEATNGIATISLRSESEESTSANGDVSNGNRGGDMSDIRVRSLEKTGKKVCKPWLDYLVTNMYQDLRAMAMWNAEEQQHSAAAALAAAALARKLRREVGDGDSGSSSLVRDDVEGQELEHDYRRSADEVATTTKRPAADWLRRGELALRLGKIEEAKTAYWTCVKLAAKEKMLAVTALSRIMKLSSKDGDTRTTLRCADAVWNYVDANTDRKGSSEPTAPVPEVRTSIFRIISEKGLRAVREMVTSKVEVDRKRMEGLLLDSVALQVDGFSR